jgi:hypothetical protein
MGTGEYVRHPFKLCGPDSESERNSKEFAEELFIA